MCNPKPSSSSPFLCPQKNHIIAPNPKLINHHPPVADQLQDELHRWPTPKEVIAEMKAIGKISGPTAVTGLILYSRAMISMLLLGYLGEMELAEGFLSIGFANITGYSVISGLTMGMEPICGQPYGANQLKTLGITLQKTVLLSTSIPISITWLNINNIFLWCGQDQQNSSTAQTKQLKK